MRILSGIDGTILLALKNIAGVTQHDAAPLVQVAFLLKMSCLCLRRQISARIWGFEFVCDDDLGARHA